MIERVAADDATPAEPDNGRAIALAEEVLKMSGRDAERIGSFRQGQSLRLRMHRGHRTHTSTRAPARTAANRSEMPRSLVPWSAPKCKAKSLFHLCFCCVRMTQMSNGLALRLRALLAAVAEHLRESRHENRLGRLVLREREEVVDPETL